MVHYGALAAVVFVVPAARTPQLPTAHVARPKARADQHCSTQTVPVLGSLLWPGFYVHEWHAEHQSMQLESQPGLTKGITMRHGPAELPVRSCIQSHQETYDAGKEEAMLEAEGAEATGTDAAASGAPDASGTDLTVAAAEQPGIRYRAQPHTGRCVSNAPLCCFPS